MPIVSCYSHKGSRQSKPTVLEIHSQIHEVDSSRGHLRNERQQVFVAHLVRNVFDHHRGPRVQSLFDLVQIELIFLRDRGRWDARRSDMQGGRGMVRLLILMTGGNQSFGWGVLITGDGGGNRRNGAEQDGGGMGMVGVRWHAFRVINSRRMHDGG